MEMSTLGVIFKVAGGQFFSYMMPRIKNSKFFRDIKKRWIKDNYALKTKLIFQGAVEDAKSAFNLPDDLISKLLKDSLNREEVFRWILEGTSSDQFDSSLLNLEPYMESYPEYQDMLRPFFEMILINLDEYKQINWEPEFLELLHQVSELQEITEKGFINVEQKQDKAIQILEANKILLEEVISPVEFEDLNKLLEVEKLTSAREKAQERLKKGHLKQNEILELNAIIANTYIGSGQEKKAIKHLYTCVNNCEDVARQKRLESLINLIEQRLDDALTNIEESIEIEGYNKKNLEVLLNIYFQQEKYESALKIIQENPKEDLDKMHAYVLRYLRKFNDAIELINNHLKRNDNNIDWIILKAETLVLKVEYDIKKNILIDSVDLFKEVMPLLDQLKLEHIENIGILTRVKEIKAGLYFRNKNYAEAKVLYEDVYRSDTESSDLYFKNLLLSCYGDQDWERAIVLLKETTNNEKPEIKNVIELANVYVQAHQTEEAIKLLESFKEHIDIKSELYIDYYIIYLDALLLDLKYYEINQMILSIENETEDLTNIHIIKGYYSLKLHDWKKAITHFESCIDFLEGNELVEVKILLSAAYSNISTEDNYKKLKELLVSIPNWMQEESLIDRYTNALFELGEYDNVISFSKQLPENTTLLLDRIATIYLNSGWFELAKTNYLTLFKRTKELGYQLRYSHCLYRLGDTKKCLQVLESAELRVQKAGRIEDFSLLSAAFAEAMQYRKSLHYAYQTYLVGQEDPSAWKFFFARMAYLSRFIEKPETAWVKDFKHIMNEFSNKFPDEPPLGKQMSVTQDNGDISSELIEEVKKGYDSSQEMKNLFKQHKLSTSLVVTLMNTGPFVTWGHVMNEKDMDLWITPGSWDDIKNGELSARKSKKVMCDIPTLLTLQHLDVLDKLPDLYELYIHQKQFDAIFEEYSQTKIISDQGLKTMIYHEGNIAIQEFSSEQVNDTIKRQEEFIDWINNNCKKLGSIISNKKKKDVQNEGLAFFLEPMEVSKTYSCSILVDSVTTKNYARENYGIDCFTSLDLLNLLSTNKAIDKEHKIQLLGKLMMTGHSLLPINKDVCMFYLRRNNFKLISETLTLFDYLKKQEFSKLYLINLFGDLLASIWIENISLYERKQLTDHICSVLTTGYRKYDIILRLIEDSKTKFSILVEHQWEQMKICVQQWCKAQLII
ncbi:hypothetical protein ABEX35_08710 [Priestia megaterium]|uniref:tetratricopeptide repeat protein n=3 Tax=Priestia megaterium TaxID=1404 RepID=UPI000BF94636|nr:hypothetical protein [Priestia megaterium]PFJ96629.1 hypothetical protein COI96_24665 [Priestia megaterium]